MLKRNRDIDRRSRLLAKGERGSGPVVYWMSRDQRAADNWALLWAQQEALIREKPLCVVFCLDPALQAVNQRQHWFMMKGLVELQERLATFNISFHLLEGRSVEILPDFLHQRDAHLLAADFNPLRGVRKIKDKLARSLSLPIVEIDAHNIIPVWTTSEKKEYAAYTIRPKINRLRGDYLTDIPPLVCHPYRAIDGTPFGRFSSDSHLTAAPWCDAGEQGAAGAMREAVEQRLVRYSEDRNNPCLPGQSNLSPYLHCGQVSAQRLAWNVLHSDLPEAAKEDFLEELIVRRELADNYCFYEPDYDRFSGFPAWPRKSLD
jgi:deoxyribodipyrimidine photo-lyase